MKVIVTSKGNNWNSETDDRFGRAEVLNLIDTKTHELKNFDNSENSNLSHGAGPQTAKKIFELGASVLITGNGPGQKASDILRKAGIQVYIFNKDSKVNQAYEDYVNNKLKKFNL